MSSAVDSLTGRAAVRAATANAALALAVFSSGAASLMYQVAWARRLATEMSSTPAAQAFVVGVFLAGLGVGAAGAGVRSIRTERPLLAYALVELGAAVCAAASLPALQALGRGAASGWVTGVVSSLFLLATAALLGASLPFVIEQVDRANAGKGAAAGDRLVGLLYGTNTLGAVSGALLAGFVTIEQLGLRATILCGGAIALVAVAIATCLAALTGPVSVRPTQVARPAASKALEPRLAICAALAGMAGVGAEIADTRLLALVVHNTVYVFAEVLAGVLIGIAAGGFLAAAVLKRIPQPGRVLSKTVLGLAGAAVLMAASPSVTVWLAGTEGLDASIASGAFASAFVVFALVAPPAALVAAALPLLVAASRRSSASEAFGLLYAFNTGGSVAGSLLVGFLLLPWAGLANAVTAMAASALAAGAALTFGKGRAVVALRPRLLQWAIAGTAVTVIAFQVSRRIPLEIYEAHLPQGLGILDFRESTVSDVMVTDDHEGHRRLWINSAWVAGTGGGHRVLGLLPPLFVAEPRQGLGIALGTGQTFATMFQHGLSRLDCVEINPGVIALSKRWFGDFNDHLFEKAGVFVHRDDGRAFLRNTDRRFDLIILEPLQAWSAGTANLYTREFYEEARRALAPGGVVAQWIPFYGQTEVDTRAMVRAGADVFPSASLWLDENDGILVLSDAPFSLDPGTLESRMRARGVDALLEQKGIGSVADLLSLFVMGPTGIRTWVRDAPILDDDHPFLEFSAARNRTNPNRHLIFASARANAEDATAYIAGDAGNPGAIASEARAVQQALLEIGTLAAGDHEEAAKVLERALAAAPNSELLSERYGQEMLGWAATLRSDIGQARRVYESALKRDPKQGEVLMALADLYAKHGQVEEARKLLLRARDIPRVSKQASEAFDRMTVGH